MSTYLENYQSHLEIDMAAGGKPERMESCVTEFNAAGADDYKVTPAFRKWALDVSHRCSNCGKDFKLDLEKAAVTKPTDESACTNCSSSTT